MAFSKASVKYKPLRIGFVVREGHVEDLVKVAGINSLLWGGIYNPILPVNAGDDNSFAEQLMKLFSVDILYPVIETPEIRSFVDKYPFLRDPGHYAEKIFYEDWNTKKQVSGFLDIKNMVDLFWNKEFKSKQSSYNSNFALINWDDHDPLVNVFALQFGFFPSISNLKWDYKKIFIKGLRAKEVNISPNDNLTMNPRKTFGPIDATGAELRGYSTGVRINENGIYIGDANDYLDLISFWNIRASNIRVVYLAKDQLERNLPFAQSFLDFLNNLPDSHPNIEDRLSVYYRFEDDGLIMTLSDRISSKKGIAWHHVTQYSWNGLNIQPCYQVFKWQSVTTNIEPAYGKYVVNIKLPEKTFLINEDDVEISSQQFGVIIDSYGDFGYPGYTLNPPKIRELNEFFSREMADDPWSLRVGNEGITKIINPNDDSIDLYPIDKYDLIVKIFEVAGIKAQISQPGRIAKKIIEMIGGLEDARVFKIKGARKILQEGTPDSCITRGHAVKTIFESDFEKYKRLFIEARESPDLTSNAVFDYLLKKDIFRAGLELICVHCRLNNWLSLKNIDDIWICEYCGGKNQTSIQLKDRGDWKFRKSGLFAKDNNQEGAIPVLLSLLAIKRIFDHSNFTYSTALELKGTDIRDCETDLCIIQQKHGNEIEIGIGECKSNGGYITHDDCNKLKSVAERLQKLDKNIKVYIIFANTSDSFLPDEIELFTNLNRDIPVVLMTTRELEPYHIYWKEGGSIDEDVPEKYPHSFADLARNSLARYLKQ